MHSGHISPRDFLRGSSWVSGAALGGCHTRTNLGCTRVVRLAHVTDIHVDARSRAREGMARAIATIHAHTHFVHLRFLRR